jgi:hypothetical protein
LFRYTGALLLTRTLSSSNCSLTVHRPAPPLDFLEAMNLGRKPNADGFWNEALLADHFGLGNWIFDIRLDSEDGV